MNNECESAAAPNLIFPDRPGSDREAVGGQRTGITKMTRRVGEDSRFTVSLAEHDDQPILVVAGAIDESTAAVLATLMVALDGGEDQYVIDLRDVTAMDPVGVTMLMTEHGRLAGEGRELILDSPTCSVWRILYGMGMNDIVTIRRAPHDPDAMSQIGSPPQRRSEREGVVAGHAPASMPHPVLPTESRAKRSEHRSEAFATAREIRASPSRER